MRALAVVCALAFSAVGCTGSDQAATTQAIERGAGRMSAASPPLELPPEDCEARAPRSRPPGFPGPVIGREPAWMGVYAPIRGQALRLPPDTPYTENGWRIKVLWLLPAGYGHPVTIRAARVDEGALPLIQLATVPRERAVLDPAAPGAYSNPETADFPSSVYFPEAGCYAFEARWPGGSWRVVLPVGR